MPTGLIVAEKMALMRAGLVGLLSGAWQHGPVEAADSLEAAMLALERAPGSMLLLDPRLLEPEVAGGLARVRGRFTGLRLIVLAEREDREAILRCLGAGAQGYVARSAGFAELCRSIEVVRGGGVAIPCLAEDEAPAAPLPLPRAVLPPVAGVPLRAVGDGIVGLTGRQRDVLRLVAEGRSTKDIARTLDLAVSTIKVHLAAVYRAVGARNRVEALCRTGLLAQGPLRHAS